MSNQVGKYRFVLLALAVLAADQWSKWWIEVNLAMHEVRPLLPNLNLTRINNTGVAFGLLPARGNLWGTILLTVLGVIALSIVLVFFIRARRSERWLLAGLGLILGGAVGNLLDRVMSGAVTDFIDFYVGSYHWHTFNVADSAISIGIVLMIVDSFFGRDTGSARPPQRAAAEVPAPTPTTAAPQADQDSTPPETTTDPSGVSAEPDSSDRESRASAADAERDSTDSG